MRDLEYQIHGPITIIKSPMIWTESGSLMDLTQKTREQTEHMPICPKCGYDQSGEFATWETQCPVHGICPKCGLGFAWADILDPSRSTLYWYIEHARGLKQNLRRTPPTLWYLLLPNRFWERVGIESQIHILRLGLWSVALVVVLHVLTTAVFIAGIFVFDYQYYQSRFASNSVLSMIANFDTSQASKILGDPAWWRESLVTAAGHPYLNPWLWPESAIATQAAVKVIPFTTGVSVLWALILGVVPTTRRIAKLRMAHVYRAGLLTLLMPVVLLETARLIDASVVSVCRFGGLWDEYARFVAPAMGSTIVIAMVIWVQWNWISAIRIGWRIRPNRLLIWVGLLGSSVCSYLFSMLFWTLIVIIEHS